MDTGVGAHQVLRDTDTTLQMSAPLLSHLLQRMTEFEHALLAEFPAQEVVLPTGDSRYELAAAAVLVALEHALAVRAAAQVGAMNSAAAVLRMQCEGLLRAAWLLFAANPAQVEKLAMPLSLAAEMGAKNLPGNLIMLAELEKVAPPGLVAPLAQFNQFSRHVRIPVQKHQRFRLKGATCSDSNLPAIPVQNRHPLREGTDKSTQTVMRWSLQFAWPPDPMSWSKWTALSPIRRGGLCDSGLSGASQLAKKLLAHCRGQTSSANNQKQIRGKWPEEPRAIIDRQPWQMRPPIRPQPSLALGFPLVAEQCVGNTLEVTEPRRRTNNSCRHVR